MIIHKIMLTQGLLLIILILRGLIHAMPPWCNDINKDLDYKCKILQLGAQILGIIWGIINNVTYV